jgi:N6-L-threonylcarbamoyladenine synthase
MKILAIETSCDETGIAIVEGKKIDESFTFAVLGSALLSQAKLHAEYGGVYPNLAKREHEKNLPIILREALEQAAPKLVRKNSLGAAEDFFSASLGAIDAIAVTQGPGLEPALWTGIEFAKKLAAEQSASRRIPLLPTNHMEGHLISSLVRHSNVLQNDRMSGTLENIKFPVLALLISGGHTEFVLMRKWFKYEVMGETLDDAVGEAFDKVARMLGLHYPGGPEISKHAKVARDINLQSEIKLPRPMLKADTCDVSFSGLKTAALYALRDAGGVQNLSADQIAAFAQEFEDAVGDVLAAKTLRAIQSTGAKTFVIGGGVAANRYLREKLQAVVAKEFEDVEFRLPDLKITGDNAIMIAEAALVRALSGIDDSKKGDFRAVGNLSIQNI